MKGHRSCSNILYLESRKGFSVNSPEVNVVYDWMICWVGRAHRWDSQTDLHIYLSQRSSHIGSWKTSCQVMQRQKWPKSLTAVTRYSGTNIVPPVWLWWFSLSISGYGLLAWLRHRWHFHPHLYVLTDGDHQVYWIIPLDVPNTHDLWSANTTVISRWCGWLATKTLRIMKLLRFFKHAWARKNGKHPAFRLLKLYLNNPCSAYFHAMDKHGTSTLPRAFANPGQWCWFNAVLQALASIHDPRLMTWRCKQGNAR